MSRLLVIAPHADDETLGCGGLLAARAAAGWVTHVAVLGLGGVAPRNGRGVAPVAERAAEFRAACRVLGVDAALVLFPGYDMRLDTLDLLTIVTKLDALLDAGCYDEVYLPYASVNHDHQITYRAALAALRPAAGRPLPRLTAAYEYALVGWQPDGLPNAGRLYVDISAHLPTKLAALACYPSQARPYPHPCAPEAVATLAQARGLEVGLAAAELFYVLREVTA